MEEVKFSHRFLTPAEKRSPNFTIPILSYQWALFSPGGRKGFLIPKLV